MLRKNFIEQDMEQGMTSLIANEIDF